MKYLIAIIGLLYSVVGVSQAGNSVGIGTTTPDASAILHLESPDQGFLMTRMDSASIVSILAPQEGLIIYNTVDQCYWFNASSGWTRVCNTNDIYDSIVSLAGDVSNIYNTLSNHSDSLGAIYDSLVVHNTNIINNSNSITSLTTIVNLHGDSLSWIYDSLSIHLTLINTMNTTINNHSDSLTAIYDSLVSHITEINNLLTIVNNHSDSLSWIYDSLGVHLTSITNNTTNIATNTANITNNTNNISDLNDSINVHRTELGNKWDINGNAGTNSTTNFLGTTDAADLTIRVNNQRSFTLDQSFNSVLGSEADMSPFNAGNTYTNNLVVGDNWSLVGVNNLYDSHLFGDGDVTGQNLRGLFMAGEDNNYFGNAGLPVGFADQANIIVGQGNTYDMTGFLTTPNLGGIFGLDNTLTNTTFYYVFGSNNSHTNGGVGLTVGASNNISTPTNGSLVVGSSNTGTGSAIVLGSGNTVGSAVGNQNVIIGNNVDVGTRSSICVVADRTTTIPSTAFTANNRYYSLYTQGYTLWTNATRTAGVEIPGGGGSWSSVSDRNMKTNVEHIDYEQVLEKLRSFEISEWSYKAQLANSVTGYQEDIRHVGVMAQDFYQAFGLDLDNRHVNALDVAGINMAAIKGLMNEIDELKVEIEKLKEDNAR